MAENDNDLLNTRKEILEVATTWVADDAMTRLQVPLGHDLLKASHDIEEAIAGLFDGEILFKELCHHVVTDFDYHFAALQLVRPDELVIETVAAFGKPAEDWVGIAKHYLEEDERLRDIQADIKLASPHRVEVIGGKDGRFDEWIFDTFQQAPLVRAFVPLFLVRDRFGEILEGPALEDWLTRWQVSGVKDDHNRGRQHRVTQLTVPEFDAHGEKLTCEVIGTIEAGYTDGRVHLGHQAVVLAKFAARCAVSIHRTLLPAVLGAVAEHARGIVGADYSSLHFEYDEADEKYVYEAKSGWIADYYLRDHPPRKSGLGQQAMNLGIPHFIPDQTKHHHHNELQFSNPEIWAKGIRAMAAIPLRVGVKKGVLYICFRDIHSFSSEEIGWLKFFASFAADAIRHATVYTQERDRGRLLTNLHSVAGNLVSKPEAPDLLRQIAGNGLNILGADVVTIYECHDSDKYILAQPAIAGRLLAKESMRTEVDVQDVPALLLKRRTPIYAVKLPDDDKILLNPDRTRPDRLAFPEREGIVSAAGIPLKFRDEIAGRDEIVGLMFINYRRQHFFPEDEQKIIETLASIAAIAIRNRRLLEIHKARDIEIISSVDLHEDLKQIVQRAVKMTGAQVGEIRVPDPYAFNDALVPRAIYRASDRVGAQEEKAVEDVAANWVKNERVSLLVNDIAKDARFNRSAAVGRGSVLAVPLLDSSNRLLGVLLVADAKTWVLQRYQPVLEALAKLAVLALLNDEAEKRLKISAKLSTLGGLTGTLLHGMKSNLRGIVCYSNESTAAASCGDTSNAVIMSVKAAKATEMIIEQMKQLRDWSEPKQEPVLLRDAVLQGLKMVTVPDSVSTKIEMSGDLPQVLGDPSLIAEVFSILMKNAVEAMPQGGQLTVRGEVQELLGRTWLIVRVMDTGVGIDALTRTTLFEPKHSSKPDGLGIGLWLAHSYIELLGGRMKVESKVADGSTFVVGLPIARGNRI